MIPVILAKEPAGFDDSVRKPGLDAIAELVGEEPARKRPGPKRKKIADNRADIPGKKFPPFWTEALPDMLSAYGRICAYLSLYIEWGTGAPSVDHMVAKSVKWDQVYEWNNYRLACSLVNGRKSNLPLVLDPVDIKKGYFALEFIAFQVIPGSRATGSVKNDVNATIKLLGLNERDCCEARREYVEAYIDRHIDLSYLERRAPFVAQELRRLGKLHPEDA